MTIQCHKIVTLCMCARVIDFALLLLIGPVHILHAVNVIVSLLESISSQVTVVFSK